MTLAPLADLTIDLRALVANYRLLADKSRPARAGAAVKGNAYGYFGNVSLFGGPLNPRGPAPQVSLPAAGSAVPLTASSASLRSASMSHAMPA